MSDLDSTNKDIMPRDNKGLRHGYWEMYHFGGELEYKGNYIRDIAVGLFVFYTPNGDARIKYYFI